MHHSLSLTHSHPPTHTQPVFAPPPHRQAITEARAALAGRSAKRTRGGGEGGGEGGGGAAEAGAGGDEEPEAPSKAAPEAQQPQAQAEARAEAQADALQGKAHAETQPGAQPGALGPPRGAVSGGVSSSCEVVGSAARFVQSAAGFAESTARRQQQGQGGVPLSDHEQHLEHLVRPGPARLAVHDLVSARPPPCHQQRHSLSARPHAQTQPEPGP